VAAGYIPGPNSFSGGLIRIKRERHVGALEVLGLLQERQESPRLISMDSALRHERRTSVGKGSETIAHP
jgi:hypothetical protein